MTASGQSLGDNTLGETLMEDDADFGAEDNQTDDAGANAPDEATGAAADDSSDDANGPRIAYSSGSDDEFSDSPFAALGGQPDAAPAAEVEIADVPDTEAGPDAASEADAPAAAEAQDADEAAAEATDEVPHEEASKDEEKEIEEEPVISPYDRPGRWFVVHTYAGHENQVHNNLRSRIQSMNMENKIYEVVIPMEDHIEFKGGKKTVVQKKVFPGYLMVRMRLEDEAWLCVRHTPGVTGFVSSGNKPIPLTRREVERILVVKPDKKLKPKLEWEVGQTVRVIGGPFADFNGNIDDINVDQSKLKVLVNIFGRETPVELGFDQVAKL